MTEPISYIKLGDQEHPIDAVTVNGLSFTSEEKELWNNKQDALSFDSIPTENSNNLVKSGPLYSVITENELITATALNDLNDRVTSLEDFSETDPTVPEWAKASTKPTYTASEVGALPDTTVIPTESTITGWGFTKNSGTVTGISMNGSLIGTSGVIDLGTVLTSHQDITGKADKSEAIGSLTLSIDSSNYQITLSGTKVDGTTFSVSNVIDLPLESVVVSGSYNDSTKKVVLTLQNGNTIDFSVADLVTGLQSEITSSNKLSADLISDGNTNKVVTSTEKSTWNSAVRSVTFNGSSVSVSNGSISMSESDPVFSASPAAGISAADISNWNSKTSNTGTLTGVTFNGTSASVSNGVASISVSIPAEVTEATVSSWGFTKNSGTLTSHATHKLNIGSATATAAASNTITYVESLTGTTTATSGNLTITPTLKTITVPAEVTESTVAGWGFTKNTGTITSETDPIFSASVAASISASDISNWNSKTSNTGTITGISMNGSSKGTSGNVNLGTVVTGLSMNGSSVSISNGVANLGTVLTSHQSIKTINGQTITGTGDVTISSLPTATSSDNGKILQVVNGSWTLVTPVSIYSGNGSPDNGQGTNGDLYIQTS